MLDLGAAPGGWSIVARGLVGPEGRVVAVDNRLIEAIPGVRVIRARVGESRLIEALREETFDVVLSDMSPSISGAYATDHARSVALVREALLLSQRVLREGGTFVAKVFQGDLVAELRRELETVFDRVVLTKPPASRERSSEMYLIGLQYMPLGLYTRPHDATPRDRMAS